MPKTAAAPAITLCALRAEAVERDGVTLPDRLRVAPWGAHSIGGRGKAIIGAATAQVFGLNMIKLKRDDHVCLDFNHNSLPGHASYAAEKEPRLIAATGKPEMVEGQGIFLTALTWTPEGKAAFLGGHFQDISPAVYRDKAGNVIAIHSAALCQHGEIDGLTIPDAVQAALSAEICALSASDSPLNPSMKPTPALIALCAVLGVTLAADADEASVDTSLTDLTAKIKAEGEKKDQPTALTAIETRLATVESERDAMKRDRLKEQAIAQGKVIPLKDEVWNVTALSTCEALVAGLTPGTVPLGRKTPAGEVDPNAKADALSAETEEVLLTMGLSKEDYEKFGPKAAAAK
jgi:phage I-like protein